MARVKCFPRFLIVDLVPNPSSVRGWWYGTDGGSDFGVQSLVQHTPVDEHLCCF